MYLNLKHGEIYIQLWLGIGFFINKNMYKLLNISQVKKKKKKTFINFV